MSRKELIPWWFVAAIPAGISIVLFSWNVASQGYLIFGRLDLLVMLATIAYLVAIPLFIRNRKSGVAWTVLMVFTGIMLFVADGVTRLWIPQPVVSNFPWPPMKRIRDVTANLPGVSSPARFSVNRWGIRGPDQDPASASLRILCVGGSTTECLYVTDEQSWPWRMGTLLEEALHRSTFVGNAGRSGHIAANHAYLIENYVAISDFEWVIVLCGINDVGALLHHNLATREAHIPEETLFSIDRPHEAYYRRLPVWRLMEVTLDVGTPVADGQILQDPAGRWINRFRQQRQEKLAKHPLTEMPAELPSHLDLYRRDLRRVIKAAADKNLKLLMMTQPSMWKADLEPAMQLLLTEQVDKGAYTTAALATLMDQYNQAMLEICLETETPCLDLASMLPADTSVFYDDCHYNDGGCEKIAKIVSTYLRSHFLENSQRDEPTVSRHD